MTQNKQNMFVLKIEIGKNNKDHTSHCAFRQNNNFESLYHSLLWFLTFKKQHIHAPKIVATLKCVELNKQMITKQMCMQYYNYNSGIVSQALAIFYIVD